MHCVSRGRKLLRALTLFAHITVPKKNKGMLVMWLHGYGCLGGYLYGTCIFNRCLFKGAMTHSF